MKREFLHLGREKYRMRDNILRVCVLNNADPGQIP